MEFTLHDYQTWLLDLFYFKDFLGGSKALAQRAISQGNNPRWLQMIANANLEHPKAAADEAAREFCVEWLEAQGFKVTLEARDDHDSD